MPTGETRAPLTDDELPFDIHQAPTWNVNPAEDLLDGACQLCHPLPCDDPDQHLGVPERYTPLKNRGCRCGADFDGRDCMCFEESY